MPNFARFLPKIAHFFCLRIGKVRLRRAPMQGPERNDLAERRAVQMNKLESFLLKLAIPFIKIAHFHRSPNLKVKGDLILISADLSYSLSKILPQDQRLVPVAFRYVY